VPIDQNTSTGGRGGEGRVLMGAYPLEKIPPLITNRSFNDLIENPNAENNLLQKEKQFSPTQVFE